MVTREIIW